MMTVIEYHEDKRLLLLLSATSKLLFLSTFHLCGRYLSRDEFCEIISTKLQLKFQVRHSQIAALK